MDQVSASVCMLLLGVTSAINSGILQSHMPNVCAEREVMMIGHRQPCVQAFTRMAKVWKQGCGGQKWCVGHERRTAYYTAYRQVYSMDFQVVYKCCPGWIQLNNESGCLYPVCSYGVCFNGGKCIEGMSQLCHCPQGFQGPRCQYGELEQLSDSLGGPSLTFVFSNFAYPTVEKLVLCLKLLKAFIVLKIFMGSSPCLLFPTEK
ncbi:multiple epidermal growth factor-like domains protein 6 [Carcharodon carcharias]|uniref:multiple epidermal growth factor-like domains protein 6 n=1 Tax=Carcharodon carcharias TaxID=13397 RepID=UPI001B7E2E87|nr:multiple epidermal growth factor-like domains protein 6 [Carcharodon carcharias]